jgi:hypothetical protein
LRDVISIYQRLKSGAELDQLGVKGLRRSWCRQRQGCAKGSASSGHASGLGEEGAAR